MDDELRLRVRESPTGGSRIAFSYLALVLGGVLAGLLAAMASPLAAAACRTTDDVTCLLGWTFGSTIVALAVSLALVAFVLRLGWEWWAVVAALLLGSPWWSGLLPLWGSVVLALLTPAAAGAATLTGRRRPAWRPWVIGAAALALVAAGVFAVVA